MKQETYEKLKDEFGAWVLDVETFDEIQCALVYDMLTNIASFINRDIERADGPILDITDLPMTSRFIDVNLETLQRKGNL